MFLTTHAAAGILISRYVHNPYAVFGLAFASHFVLDFIPHGDEHLYGDYQLPGAHRWRKAAVVNLIDLTGLVGLIIWAIGQHTLPNNNLVTLGILGSILPDFLSHFFPFLHQRMSWLFLIRWLYGLTKPTGVRYLVRAQNWLHDVLHHDIVRRDIPFRAGLALQVVLLVIMLAFVH